MAGIRLQLPEPFNFKQPDEWTRWKRRFEQYRVASGLAEEGEARQVCTLLYCMGEEAGDVLTTTKIEEADRKKYDKVIDKFDGFFKVRRNTVFERAKFNRRNQRDDESVEQYITALFHLRETCDFGDGALADELLRDKIIVGIRDTKLAETLMLDPDMSLDEVMRAVRQKEAVHEQNRQLKRGTQEDPIVVDHIGCGGKPQKSPGLRFMRRRKPETGQRDHKTTAYVNDVGKTVPPQTGAQPEEQPVLNATGKVTFRLFV